MIGDPHEPRCDWLQQARLEFRSNVITVHGETFVKMAAVEEIINRLSEERQRCYKAHSKRSICNCEPKAKGNDTDPKMCKVCLPEAYMREGCSCLDMHDAVIARAAREDERKSQTNKCHTCRTLQWDNRLIWSLESLLAWVRTNHMDQIDIRDHIDLMLGEYRNELESRQKAPAEKHSSSGSPYITDMEKMMISFDALMCIHRELRNTDEITKHIRDLLTPIQISVEEHDRAITQAAQEDERKKILHDISKWRKEMEAKGNEGDISACAAWLEEDVFLLSLSNPTSLKSEITGDPK
jgi:hypothetical protein